MFLRIYRYFNILSLDVALGACICSKYLAKVMNVNIAWSEVVTLGLTVWLIYTFDHLQDAIKIKGIANTERYRFHQQNLKALTLFCALSLLIISALVFKLSIDTIIYGSALACVVFAYFLLLYFLGLKASYHKEISIAVIYASGVSLAPFSQYDGEILTNHILTFIQFVNIALINLILFSWFEHDKDTQNGFPSLVNILGIEGTRKLVFVLSFFQLVAAIASIFYYNMIEISLIILTMTSTLTGIALYSKYFSSKERYRLVGDFVFIIPAVGML